MGILIAIVAGIKRGKCNRTVKIKQKTCTSKRSCHCFTTKKKNRPVVVMVNTTAERFKIPANMYWPDSKHYSDKHTVVLLINSISPLLSFTSMARHFALPVQHYAHSTRATVMAGCSMVQRITRVAPGTVFSL